jgi:hypothetical protein
MPVSQNGYSACNEDQIKTWAISGTSRKVRLRAGDPGWLLAHFASWFHKHVESIDSGQLDDWGYNCRDVRDGEELSNHASGTAIDLNALKHPRGVRNTYTAAQERAIRAQLELYDDCVRWGEDYVRSPADGMHFEIVRPLAAVSAVVDRIENGTDRTTNLTIALQAIQFALAGRKITDSYLADARQYLAHLRSRRIITSTTEMSWDAANAANDLANSSRHMHDAVTNHQEAEHIAPDGIFGPVTARTLKRFGYIPIGLDGRPL